MPSTLARDFKRRFAVPYGCYKLIFSRQSFLRETGWFDSIRASAPSSAAGTSVPWMNYAVVDLIADRMCQSFDVFEYGSGYSTRFFASLARSVISVEYDRNWYDQVRENLPHNARIILQPFDGPGRYAEVIKQFDRAFDVVVIDGQDRNGCVGHAIDKLSDSGVLILDDSNRADYQIAFEWMKKAGFRSLSIAGLKPGSVSRHETTIFYREKNCFEL